MFTKEEKVLITRMCEKNYSGFVNIADLHECVKDIIPSPDTLMDACQILIDKGLMHSQYDQVNQIRKYQLSYTGKHIEELKAAERNFFIRHSILVPVLVSVISSIAVLLITQAIQL